MKNTHKILVTIYAFFCIVQLHAQAPLAIPYQGVARNGGGNILANQNISLRFSIHNLNPVGTIVYSESQNTTTNAHGLFSLNIGTGVIISGTMSSVDWGNGSKFLEVEMDPAGGTSYISMGVTQMMSVPFALYAGKASTSTFFNSAYGYDPQNTVSFLTAPLQIQITSSSQKVIVTSSKALGCGGVAGTDLNLYIGYNSTGFQSPVNTVGGGSFGYKCAINTRMNFTLSGEITGLAPGLYYVGLVGSASAPLNWNSNEWGYTTAVVYN